MLIYRYELKKLLKSAAVWGFIAVCLLFNIILISNNSGSAYADFVNTVAEDTGYILDQSFYEKLSQVTASDNQKHSDIPNLFHLVNNNPHVKSLFLK
jgi:ABC-type transport system involved in multi-copper enzyme maturation permease subunit